MESLPRNCVRCPATTELGQCPGQVIALPLYTRILLSPLAPIMSIWMCPLALIVYACVHLFDGGLKHGWTRDLVLFDLQRGCFWFFRNLIIFLKCMYAQKVSLFPEPQVIYNNSNSSAMQAVWID